MTLDPYKHCGFCGAAFTALEWPRACVACDQRTWRAIPPVANAVVRTEDGGVVLVRRDIEPSRGQWALAGGHLEFGETWESAATREFVEETGYEGGPLSFRLHSVRTGTRSLLIFATSSLIPADALAHFKPNEEVSEVVIAYEAVPLAFPTHTEVLADVLLHRVRRTDGRWVWTV